MQRSFMAGGLRPAFRVESLVCCAQVWDVRARGCQREYESRAPVNCAVLHPNQGELISGAGLR